jgi:hypothetical protein
MGIFSFFFPRPTTVDSIMAGFTTTIDQLEQLQLDKLAENDQLREQITKLENRSDANVDEIVRARRISDKLMDLVMPKSKALNDDIPF